MIQRSIVLAALVMGFFLILPGSSTAQNGGSRNTRQLSRVERNRPPQRATRGRFRMNRVTGWSTGSRHSRPRNGRARARSH